MRPTRRGSAFDCHDHRLNAEASAKDHIVKREDLAE